MLLTAEEVAQWVRHAVQLPQDVADAFLRNAVTGYDFHELTQNQVGTRGGGRGVGAGGVASKYNDALLLFFFLSYSTSHPRVWTNCCTWYGG